MNIQFANTWILYFLWLVPLIGFSWIMANKRREIRIQSFMSPNMQAKLRPDISGRRFTIQSTLIAVGIFFMLIALARPQWGTREYKVFRRGRDVIIALDVSRSMLANDTHPNRLQRAKADIMDLIAELDGDRAALLVFRHKAALRCPLTSDYAFLQQSLDSVTIDSAPKGETDIGDAISNALDAFDNESGSHKAIILISDGEDLSGRALEAADEAGKRNIPIFTVGLGSNSGSKIPEKNTGSDYVKYKGESVVTKLDQKSLYELAKRSGGAYIQAATANMNLGSLYKDHLKTVSKQDLEETHKSMLVERFQLFLIPAIIFMLAGCFLSRGRLGAKTKWSSGIVNETTLNSSRITLILLALISAISNTAIAQTNLQPASNAVTETQEPAKDSSKLASTPAGREGARLAQKLYKKGKFEEAASVYLDAAKGSTAKSQHDFRYNAAISLYNAGKYKESADILRDETLSTSHPVPGTTSALGTALYKAADPERADSTNIVNTAKLLKEAGEAFKEAARADESKKTAMESLGIILNKLPDIQNEAKIAKLMETYGASDASELSFKMMNNQRAILEGIPQIMTNDSPSQIKQFEHYSALQKENSEIWIPLKNKMMNALAQQQSSSTNNNQQQMAEIFQHLDAIQNTMIRSSNELRDLNSEGFQSASSSQAGIYSLWKSMAPHQQLLQEDIRLQSNTITETSLDISTQKPGVMQKEAATLTELFAERFKMAVPETDPTNAVQTETQSQPGEINAEDREKILNYAEMAITAQKLAEKHLSSKNTELSLKEEQTAYDLLKEIEKLLPKKDQNQENQQQQDQKQQQEPQDQKQNQQQQDQQEQEQQPEEQQPMKPEDSTPEEVRKLLEKALEREKEHEAEKERRNSYAPMSPHERDW